MLKINDRVTHIKDCDIKGTIVEIDENLIELGYDVTTCRVLWDDSEDGCTDIQWTNKLVQSIVG